VNVGYSVSNGPPNQAVCAAYSAQSPKREVIAAGTVTRILGSRRGPSGTHEGFLLKLRGGCDLTVRVETNTDLTGPVPISNDEMVVVKGEYVYYSLGGVLHWTHHDPRGHHEGGYVYADGKMYQ
jgi:hypothetical protein